MFDSGRYASVTEPTHAEKINRSSHRRILRLTPLAPDIVEAVMEGRATVPMAEVMGFIHPGGMGRTGTGLLAAAWHREKLSQRPASRLASAHRFAYNDQWTVPLMR